MADTPPLDHCTLAKSLANHYGAEYKAYKADPNVVYVSKENDETGNGWQIVVCSDLRWWVNRKTHGEVDRIADGQVEPTDTVSGAWATIWLAVPLDFFRS